MGMTKTTWERVTSIRCAHCKGRHGSIAEVKACSMPVPHHSVAAPEHNHPWRVDPTMRMNCEPCGIVHAMSYDRSAGRYRCTLQDGPQRGCPACQA